MSTLSRVRRFASAALFVADGDAAPEYWYYCPSYGDSYPNVPTCADPWVPEAVS